MKKKVVKQYTEMSKEYDKTIRQLIPHYEAVLKSMAAFLPFDNNQVIDILDIGSGTGYLSQLLKQRFFYSEITCLDVTVKMIKSAKQKLANYSNIHYVCKRVQDFTFKKNQYDAVVVSMVFQHLENQRTKFSLYKKICNSLKKEGIFLMFGPVKAPNDFIEAYYMKKWSLFLQQSFIKKKSEDGCLTTYAEKDGPESFLKELAMLQKAGFQYVDVLYKQDNFAIFAAMNFKK